MWSSYNLWSCLREQWTLHWGLSAVLLTVVLCVAPASQAEAQSKKVEASPAANSIPGNEKCPVCAECPPCPAAAPESLPADMALLDGLRRLMATDAGARIEAVGDLRSLLDDRVVEPLGHTLRFDGDAKVRAAAARGLAGFAGAASEEVLLDALNDRREAVDVRLAAGEALGEHSTDSAFDNLWVARGDDDSPITKNITKILQEKYPRRYAARLEKEPELDLSGRWMLVPPMAIHGAIFMTGLAELAGGEPGFASVMGGLTVGGLTPYLLTTDTDMPKAQALWLDSTITWGLIGGVGTYAMLGGVEDEESPALSIVAGQAAGLTAGLLTHKKIPYSAGDVGYMNVAGIAGGWIAFSPLIMAEIEDPATVASTVQTGIAAGLITSGMWVRDIELSTGDQASIAWLTAFSMWFGGGLPVLLFGDEVSSRYTDGSTFLGGGLGFIGASYLSQRTEPRLSDVGESIVGTLWGASIGYGLGMVSRDAPSARTITGMGMGGALTGLITTSFLADDSNFSRGDLYATGLGMGWGLWQFTAFGDLIFDEFGQNRRVAGMTYLGFGLGGVGTAISSNYFDPTPMEVLMAGSVGVWGGWLSGWGGYVGQKNGAGISDDAINVSTLLGADAGLALGSLLVSSAVQMPAKRLGWINAAGLLGMGIGTSFTAIFSEQIAEGNLVGTTAGLVTGVMLTSKMEFEPPRKGAQLYRETQSPWDSLVWWPTATVAPDDEGRAHLQLGVMGFY